MNQDTNMDMLNFDLPKGQSSIIKVIGVGGGGNNAVNHMYLQGIEDVDFINCNTDRQALEASPVPNKIKLGARVLGAGSNPEVGRVAAEESRETLRDLLEKNTKMVFVTAGMGGGTGTGGAPVIASIANELGILTVGIVTAPFTWEGKRRNEQAKAGIAELKKYVDIILVIENDKLREQYGDQKITESFKKADDILASAARSIAEIITKHGLVNLDFEDINTVMNKGGEAIMGVGGASGEGRSLIAAEAAINSPLLNNNDLNGANNVLVYIASGSDEITMDEVSEITEFIQKQAGNNADVIWGFGQDESLTEEINVTVIATGFNKKVEQQQPSNPFEKPLYQPVISNSPIQKHDLTTAPAPKIEQKVSEIYTSTEGITKIHSSLSESILNIVPEQPQKTFEEITEPVLITRTKTDKEEQPAQPIEVPKRLTSEWRDKPDAETVIELNRLKSEQLKNYGILNKSRLTLSQMQELESVPAYLRQKIQLSDTPHSSESQVSRYSLFDGELNDNNSFLHDNVD